MSSTHKKKRSRVLLACLAGAAVVQGLAVSAHADVETVVVTGELIKETEIGTKTDTPLVETPQSITVIGHDQIQAQGLQSIAQVLRYAPGIVSEPRGVMTGLDYFYARGFQLDQYLDGLKLLSGNYSLPQPEPYLMEQVEILRGPSSILYGQAAPGGIVNLVSKRPSADPFGEIQIQAGNYNRIQGTFDLTGPLNDDASLTGRITAIAKDNDTQVQFAHEQRFVVAPSLTWRIDDATTITFLASYQNDPDVGYYNWIPALGTVLPNINSATRLPTSLYTGDPDFDRWTRETATIGYSLEHRFSDSITLHQNVRFFDAKSDFRNIYSSFLGGDERTLFRYAWHVNDSVQNVDVDTNAMFKFDTGALAHTLLVGFDYQHTHYRQRLGYDFATVPSLDIFAPVYHVGVALPPDATNNVQLTEQEGVYAQDQIAIGNFRFLAGGRQDWVQQSAKEEIVLPPVPFLDQPQKAFTGRLGAVYLFDAGFAPYASYTESFQPQTGADFFGTLFQPTTGQQYEIGLKYQPQDTQTLITVSFYQLRQQNVLADDSDPLHGGAQIQVGEITSKGFEIWGASKLTDALDVTASYSYVAQDVTKGGSAFGPQFGATPADIPAQQANLWLNYSLKNWGLDGLNAGLGVRYLGTSWGDDAPNTFKVPDTALFDATLAYDFGDREDAFSGVRLAINANNVFDKIYVAGCGGADYCAYGARRTILATVGKSF